MRPLVLPLSFLVLMLLVAHCSPTPYQSGMTPGGMPGQEALSDTIQAAHQVALVDSLLGSMMIEEKIGQMLTVKMPGNYISTQGEQFERLQQLIRQVKPGGMLLLQGNIYETAVLLNKLQRLSTLPLLVGADLENGLAMRLRKATWFPPAMAVAATRNQAYAYDIGAATAAEARAVGIHQNYAPVVDVNTNPENPVINTRAYGDRPGLVDTMAVAFLQGSQDSGVAATLKHFPGHGSSQEDSHIGLPVIPLDRARLDSVDLATFRKGISSGTISVMVGHVEVPALDPTPGIPASLSRRIITGILREEMGFQGLVVSDAMDMAGVRGVGSSRAAVMAVQAGVDILLMTTAEEGAAQALVQAVRTGEITVARIDSSVRRILSVKEQLGLFANRLVDVDRISDHVGTPAHWALARQVARDAVTILKNEKQIIPLRPLGRKRVLSLLITDSEDGRVEVNRQSTPLANEPFGTYFTRLLQARRVRLETLRLTPASNKLDFEGALRQIKKSDVVLLSLFIRVRSSSGTVGLPDAYRTFLAKLHDVQKPIIVIGWGNPYLLGSFPNARAVVCAYADAEVMTEAVADALFGEGRISGQLPVAIPGAFDYGAGLVIGKGTGSRSEAIQGSAFPEGLLTVDSLITRAIADSAFPGAQLAIVRDSAIFLERTYGKYTYDVAAQPVDRYTLYDLASLTKVFATTAAVMKLYDEGKLSLDDHVATYLSGFTGPEKEKVTIRHLLLHRGGFPPFRRLSDIAATPEAALDSVFATPLVAHPGDSTIYSDLGMISLGKVVERITGTSLDRYVQREFYAPLGMTHTMFNPPPELVSSAAPTEYDAVWRKTLVRGTVHDENAALLGGVSGHAGLFSTASDLALFMRMLINGGTYEGKVFFHASTIDAFLRTREPAQERWLGWDMKAPEGSSAGSFFSASSFGHTGFTGTSVWADPANRIAVIFLTNRVYPSRTNSRLFRVRPLLHDAIARALARPRL